MGEPSTEQIEGHHFVVLLRERDAARLGIKQIATRLGLHHRATVEQIIEAINHMDDAAADIGAKLADLQMQVAAGEARVLARVVRRG